MFDNIKADVGRKLASYNMSHLQSIHNSGSAFWNTTRVILEMGTLAVIIYRFGKWALGIRSSWIRKPLLVAYFLMNCGVMALAGISIQVDSNIGPGFIIHNFSCIFILAEQIGENCTVNQGVTVGRIRGRPRLPMIGNNVYLGAGCKILGDVVIGNNVVIAANSFVMTSVPDNCTVAGVPARIVSSISQSEYLTRV